MNNNTLTILQDWFKSNCNGDWEHDFGIKIETLDNPGWHIILDLEDTALEKLSFKENSTVSDDDWFFIEKKNSQLIASGDVNKLDFLLNRITELLAPTLAHNKV